MSDVIYLSLLREKLHETAMQKEAVSARWIANRVTRGLQQRPDVDLDRLTRLSASLSNWSKGHNLRSFRKMDSTTTQAKPDFFGQVRTAAKSEFKVPLAGQSKRPPNNGWGVNPGPSYDPRTRKIWEGHKPKQEVTLHEYGHHIDASRRNTTRDMWRNELVANWYARKLADTIAKGQRRSSAAGKLPQRMRKAIQPQLESYRTGQLDSALQGQREDWQPTGLFGALFDRRPTWSPAKRLANILNQRVDEQLAKNPAKYLPRDTPEHRFLTRRWIAEQKALRDGKPFYPIVENSPRAQQYFDARRERALGFMQASDKARSGRSPERFEQRFQAITDTL